MEKAIRGKQLEYVEEKMLFLSKGTVFDGKAYYPQSICDCKGMVVFIHGLGYCNRQYKMEGGYFAQNGYLFFTYNLRGHAGTRGIWTVEDSVDDLIECIGFLNKRFDFSSKNHICVMGHSTGALIALLATLKDKRIKLGSFVTIVTSLDVSFQHWFQSGFNKEVKTFFTKNRVLPDIINNFLDNPELYMQFKNGKLKNPKLLDISHRYGLLKSDSLNSFLSEIAFSRNILELADHIQIPLLLFRGEVDEIMDVTKINELYEKLRLRVPLRFYITDSQNHFHNDRWRLIQKETIRFFDFFCNEKKQEYNFAKKHILIIDSKILIATSLKKILCEEGFLNVSIATDCSGALTSIRKLYEERKVSFDLIVLDVQIPGVDCVRIIRRAKEFGAHIVGAEGGMIFFSGHVTNDSDRYAQMLGYVDYLRKPFSNQQFILSVKKQLQCLNES